MVTWKCPGCDEPVTADEKPTSTTSSYCSTLCWSLDHPDDDEYTAAVENLAACEQADSPS